MRYSGFLGVLCLALATTTCSRSGTSASGQPAGKSAPAGAEKLVGVWEVTKSPTLPVTALIEYMGDGKMTISVPVDGKPQVMNRGTYKVEGDTIKSTEKRAGQEVTLTFKIKTLTATTLVIEDSDGNVDEFTKK
jgi:uncharacterized protein (TIGR03066 family)